jgi:hypothetical protein
MGPVDKFYCLSNRTGAFAGRPDARVHSRPDPFVSKGEIYLKLLPEGAPVQPTHADTMKMSPVFSPDGSQIAYTVPGHWDTWIVPT